MTQGLVPSHKDISRRGTPLSTKDTGNTTSGKEQKPPENKNCVADTNTTSRKNEDSLPSSMACCAESTHRMGTGSLSIHASSRPPANHFLDSMSRDDTTSIAMTTVKAKAPSTTSRVLSQPQSQSQPNLIGKKRSRSNSPSDTASASLDLNQCQHQSKRVAVGEVGSCKNAQELRALTSTSNRQSLIQPSPVLSSSQALSSLYTDTSVKMDKDADTTSRQNTEVPSAAMSSLKVYDKGNTNSPSIKLEHQRCDKTTAPMLPISTNSRISTTITSTSSTSQSASFQPPRPQLNTMKQQEQQPTGTPTKTPTNQNIPREAKPSSLPSHNYKVTSQQSPLKSPSPRKQQPSFQTPPSNTVHNSLLSSPQKSVNINIASAALALSFKTSTSPTSTSKQPSSSSKSSSGRWTREEHEAFLQGLKVYGREWKKVAQQIPTRTSAQIRSHAQKYFAKLARDEQQQASSFWNPVVPLGGEASVDAAAIGTAGVVELPPSVLERVDKILKDPKGAQQEVEETLSRLQNRYNELQRKIREKQQSQIRTPTMFPDNGSGANIQKVGIGGGSTEKINRCKDEKYPQPPIPTTVTFLQKPSNVVEQTENANVAMTQTVSTTPAVENPTQAASGARTRQQHSLPTHLLESKELIALHVLGGELFRSGSREDLPSMPDRQHGDDGGTDHLDVEEENRKSDTDSSTSDHSPTAKSNQ